MEHTLVEDLEEGQLEKNNLRVTNSLAYFSRVLVFEEKKVL
jgi:hypothetical protein